MSILRVRKDVTQLEGKGDMFILKVRKIVGDRGGAVG